MIAVVGETAVEVEDIQRAALYFGDGRPVEELHRLALAFAQARAVEREACARVVERVRPVRYGDGGTGDAECRTWEEPNSISLACATAIRGRNKWEPSK